MMTIDMLEFDMAQVDKLVTLSDEFVNAFEIFAKKWNAIIIYLLAQKECRFSEIIQHLPQLSERILSVRLTELIALKLVEKNTHNFGKAKFTYRLTEKGNELAKALHDIERWAKKWNSER